MHEKVIQELVDAVHRLAATDPGSTSVQGRCDDLLQAANELRTSAHNVITPAKKEFLVELEPVAPKVAAQPPKPKKDPSSSVIVNTLDEMRIRAACKSRNQVRLVSIIDGLRHAAKMAERPQNVALRPNIAKVTAKVAGIFSGVDTIDELDSKSLEAIEKAVHSLYGDQSKNSTCMFERRGKKNRPEPTDPPPSVAK